MYHLILLGSKYQIYFLLLLDMLFWKFEQKNITTYTIFGVTLISRKYNEEIHEITFIT